MKALVYHGRGDIRCDQVPDPKIEDGRDAIIKLQSSELPPMLVFVDLLLPEVDGYELLVFLEGTERLARVPVVVMTALAHPPLPKSIPVLHKPLQPERVLELVRECCGERV